MPHNRCLRYINTFIFVCIRLAITIYLIFWLIPEWFKVFLFAMTLNRENWWHSKTEPWITNCSGYNAFVTWWLWICFELTFWVFCFYGILLTCALMVGLFKCSTNPVESCRNFGIGCRAFWEVYVSFLFARQIDMSRVTGVQSS